ncbi:flagellar assembly protein FliW [Paenibacillus sp. MER TA 81-3]|uniref:flagellar assembly protein FliW n=1 Tax=Paenibacillus sp. MER TA 81-3 TaxID=2939573 RepID=UPI00203F6859|nr:flagellar assembly protein FliW [Paenibacillus sp. MER TA 81-3]MCM3338733.1 flagellar assembly protein FliW [Paenibacillus sp. MER TA 81-3]
MKSKSEYVTSTVIHSPSYGELHPQPHQIYEFVKGMVGFQSIVAYALMPYEDSVFYILHAVDEDRSFILIPAENVQDYSFAIDQATVEVLEIGQPEDVVTMLVVNIIDDVISVNLRAPVLFSPKTQKGCQYIITDSNLPIRHFIQGRGE